jgi:hypothetical protein
MAATLCIPAGLALAQTPPAAHTLPIGTHLDFVADDTVNVETARTGGHYRVHLVHASAFDGTQLAPAGTPARLVIVGKTRLSDGTPAIDTRSTVSVCTRAHCRSIP